MISVYKTSKLKNYANIFLKDLILKQELVDFGYFYPTDSLNIEFYINLLGLDNSLYERKDYILSKSSKDLYNECLILEEIEEINIKYLLEIKVFDGNTMPESLFLALMNAFKYGTIKTFFYDNRNLFLPPYDVENIENSKKNTIFIKSIMKEFDKFSDIIEEMKIAKDIDKTNPNNLNYLGELLGFQMLEENVLNEDKFRIILKNMVEIYQTKGSIYSYELFFNFLGFDIEITEFWFDRRFYYSSNNPFTNISTQTSFLHYLTPYKPTDTVYNSAVYNFDRTITVNANEITSIKSRFIFEDDNNEYSTEEILGLKSGYDEPFTYFKTNIVEYRIQKIFNEVIIEIDEEQIIIEGESSLTELENEIVNYYLDYITPIFILRILAAEIKELEPERYRAIFKEIRQNLIDINYEVTEEDFSPTISNLLNPEVLVNLVPMSGTEESKFTPTNNEETIKTQTLLEYLENYLATLNGLIKTDVNYEIPTADVCDFVFNNLNNLYYNIKYEGENLILHTPDIDVLSFTEMDATFPLAEGAFTDESEFSTISREQFVGEGWELENTPDNLFDYILLEAQKI